MDVVKERHGLDGSGHESVEDTILHHGSNTLDTYPWSLVLTVQRYYAVGTTNFFFLSTNGVRQRPSLVVAERGA